MIRIVMIILSVLFASGLPAVAGAAEQLVVYTSFDEAQYRLSPLKEIIEDFERQNNVTISFAKKTALSTDEHHEVLLRLLAKKSGVPDVMQIDGIRVPEFASLGHLVDLTPHFPPQEREQFFHNSIAEVRWHDRLWSYPFFVAFGFVIYRKDLVGQPPQTWQDLIAVAQKLTTRDRFGYVGQMAQYEGLTCNVLEFMWSTGGDPRFDGTGDVFSERDEAGLKLMVDIVNRYGITPPGQLNFKEHEGIQLLKEDKVVFLRHWPLAMLKSGLAKNWDASRYGVMPIPRGEGSPAGHSALGDWTLGVNRHSKHIATAIRLVKLLASERVQRCLAQGFMRLPVRKAIYREKEFCAMYPWVEDVYPALVEARLRPRTQYYPEISAIMQKEFHRALEGAISPAKAIERANRRIKDFMRSAGR